MDRPEIIKSQYDGVRFTFWLQEHPEITSVQGWTIERLRNGVPIAFGRNYADARWLWSERRALNDWIRTYNQECKRYWRMLNVRNGHKPPTLYSMTIAEAGDYNQAQIDDGTPYRLVLA